MVLGAAESAAAVKKSAAEAEEHAEAARQHSRSVVDELRKLQDLCGPYLESEALKEIRDLLRAEGFLV